MLITGFKNRYSTILLIFLGNIAYSQTIIKGSVVSAADQEPLIGATVVIEGTSNGAVVDIEGNFSLQAQPGEVLVFSFVGFLTKKMTVGSATSLIVELEPDIATLDEVIVVGYGVQKKSDITGSVVSIRKEDFNAGPLVSINNMLQSTAPGVVLSQTSAQPGGGFDIKIRGASSSLGSNSPLYVIDGFPISNDNVQPGSSSRYRSSPEKNPLNGINPKDIESVEILKDASSTSIYGARGANGVIIITTKSGASKKLLLEYETSFSVQDLDSRYDMMNASEFARTSNEVNQEKNPGSNPVFAAAVVNTAGEGTDWIDEITRLGTIQQHQLSASKKWKKFNLYASANYFRHNGVVKVSALERYTGKINAGYKAKKITSGINLLLSRTNDSQVPFGSGDGGGAEFAGLFDNTRTWSPLLPVYDEEGNYSTHPGQPEVIPNPVSLLDIDDQIKTNRLLATTFFQYALLDGLNAKLNVGIDQSKSTSEGFIPLSVIRGAQANGELDLGRGEKSSILSEFTLTYNKKISNNSEMTILGGGTFQQKDFEGNSSLYIGVDSTRNIASESAKVTNTTRFKGRERLLSYIGRINYSISDKYLFTINFRADGSSKFGVNNKWGFFPSGAVAWKIHNEPFFNVSSISQLKLRTSYGQNGNQEIRGLASVARYTVSRQTVQGINADPIQGLAPAVAVNPDIKWETTTELNIGLDYGLFDNRIYGSVDVYRKITTDLLLEVEVPSTFGFEQINANAGSIQNQGIEFSITSRNLINTLRWTTSLNIAYNKNQWKERARGGYPEGQAIAVPDGPLSGIYGYDVIGVFQDTSEIAASLDQSAVVKSLPGDFKYRDANGDGRITPDDRVLLGKKDPDLTFGINNTFYFKQFDFSFFIQGSIGREKENFTRANLEDVDNILEGYNKTTEAANRWSPSNPSGNFPGVNDRLGGDSKNSYYIEDASFVRLRNISVGYEFAKMEWLSSLRIYADVQNLLTITPFEGLDPETDDFRQYPTARTLTVGLNATF